MARRRILSLSGVIILCAALRLLVYFHFAQNPGENFLPGEKLGDAYWYDQIAVNLRNHHGFSSSIAEPYVPDSERTPVYPMFLAAIYSVFGHNLSIAVVIQIFLATITCVLVFKTGCALYNRFSVGVVSALVFAVEPDGVFISNHVLTEVLFTLLLVAGFFLLVKYMSRGSPAMLFISFVAWAIATLTRPVALYLPVIVSVFVVFFCIKHSKPKNCIPGVVLALCLYSIIVGGWCYRNYRIFGVFEISTIGFYNLFYYNAAGIESQRLGISIDQARDNLEKTYFKDAEDIDTLNFMAKMQLAKKYAVKHIAKYPFYFLKNAVLNIVCTFLPQGAAIRQIVGRDEKTGLRDILERAGTKDVLIRMREIGVFIVFLLVVIMCLLSLIYSSVVLGIIMSVENRDLFMVFLLISIIAYLIVVPVFTGFSDARFRIPAVPFMSILAGYGLVSINVNKKSKGLWKKEDNDL